VTGWYTSSNLSRAIANKEPSKILINHFTPFDEGEPYRNYDIFNSMGMENRLRVYGGSDAAGGGNVTAVQAVYYVDGDISAVDANWRVSAPSHKQVGMASFIGPVATGTLRLSGGDFAIWLKLRQTNETAVCLRKRVCDGKGAGWLMPHNFSSYLCAEGVEVGALGLLNTYRQITKADYTRSFLALRNLSYDDVYAVYTGALGAVFGAFATSVGMVFVVLAVVLLRWAT